MIQVSILTATRNRAHYLKELMESALAQTFPHWEMVIVDNASSDETGELVAQYQVRFPGRFQYFRLPSNVGWSPGIALAAEKARGDFFLMLGDDDLLMPEILEREIEEFRKNPQLGLVYANMWVGEQPYQKLYYPQEYRGPVNQPLSVADFLNAPVYCGILIQTALFRREVYRSVGGLDLKWRFFADATLHFHITTRFPITYLPVPLAFFRRHSGNTSVANQDQAIEDEFKFWEEVSRITQDVADKRAVLDYLSRRRRGMAFHYCHRGGRVHYRRFQENLWEALKCRRSIALLVLYLLSLLPEPVFRFLFPFCLAVWKWLVSPVRRLVLGLYHQTRHA